MHSSTCLAKTYASLDPCAGETTIRGACPPASGLALFGASSTSAGPNSITKSRKNAPTLIVSATLSGDELDPGELDVWYCSRRRLLKPWVLHLPSKPNGVMSLAPVQVVSEVTNIIYKRNISRCPPVSPHNIGRPNNSTCNA